MALHPYPVNVTSFHELVVYTNTVSNNSLFAMVTFGIWIVIFVSLKSYTTGKAGAAASFATTVIATIFWLLGLINYAIVVASVVLVIIFGLYDIFQGGSS